MNKLSIDQQVHLIRGLNEGSSIASLVRMTGVAKTTILRLIVQFGEACQKLHDERVCGLRDYAASRWTRCGRSSGPRTRTPTHRRRRNTVGAMPGRGPRLTPTAKLMVAWTVGLWPFVHG